MIKSNLCSSPFGTLHESLRSPVSITPRTQRISHGELRTADAAAGTAGTGIAEQGHPKAERSVNETYPIKDYAL